MASKHYILDKSGNKYVGKAILGATALTLLFSGCTAHSMPSGAEQYTESPYYANQRDRMKYYKELWPLKVETPYFNGTISQLHVIFSNQGYAIVNGEEAKNIYEIETGKSLDISFSNLLYSIPLYKFLDYSSLKGKIINDSIDIDVIYLSIDKYFHPLEIPSNNKEAAYKINEGRNTPFLIFTEKGYCICVEKHLNEAFIFGYIDAKTGTLIEKYESLESDSILEVDIYKDNYSETPSLDLQVASYDELMIKIQEMIRPVYNYEYKKAYIDNFKVETNVGTFKLNEVALQMDNNYQLCAYKLMGITKDGQKLYCYIDINDGMPVYVNENKLIFLNELFTYEELSNKKDNTLDPNDIDGLAKSKLLAIKTGK